MAEDIWRHKQSGGLYRFLTLAILEKDRDTIMAVYETFDAEHADAEAQERWVRPAIEFYERFEQRKQEPSNDG